MAKKILTAVIAAAMVLSFAACSSKTASSSEAVVSSAVSSEETVDETETSLWDNAVYTEDTEVGEGEKTVALTVTAEEKSIVITIHTDADNLGDALVETGVAEGEDSDYGLYITTVDGMFADYEADGAYWSFYQGEEYSSVGVSEAEITADGANDFTLAYEIYIAE